MSDVFSLLHGQVSLFVLVREVHLPGEVLTLQMAYRLKYLELFFPYGVMIFMFTAT